MDMKQLNSITKQYAQYNQQVELEREIQTVRIQMENQLINDCLQEFGNKDFQNSLIQNSKDLFYSEKLIANLESYFSNWNQDTVTIDVINDIFAATTYIKNSTPKRGILTKIGEQINRLTGGEEE